MDVLVELSGKQKNAARLLTTLGAFLAYLLVRSSPLCTLALGVVLPLIFINITFLYVFVSTVYRDIIAGWRFLLMNLYILYIQWKKWPVARIFQERCREHPEKACFVIDDRKMTFQDVEDFSNKLGAYFKVKGYRKGDCVALLMSTCPEYMAIWLGLSKIGVITALINTNLRKETLMHSIQVANAKAIIVSTELIHVYESLLGRAEIKTLSLYQFNDVNLTNNTALKLMPGACDLASVLEKQKPEDLTEYISKCTHKDKLLYIYTSGTTGMPKAAVITNLRFILMASGNYHMCGIRKDDIVYNCLPVYHSAGGMVGVGNALIHGCTVALRKKFSASNFWKDCIKYNATCAQYIGELCRYLLNTPQRPEDTQHKLRLMYGNGLRSQIWLQFITRFNIPNIGELYGSTEGNSNLINIANQVGAIGFIPIIIRNFFPVQVIRVNEETGEVLRDAKGVCMRCKPGETGLLIGKIIPWRADTVFQGYADKVESEKKLLRNVFKSGDVFFNSGDMVVGDIWGYFYFKDRTGDTFRWRGENVSTQEVEAIITSVIDLKDCVVYGVEIPHVEGKAGMAAIEDPDHKIDMEHLSVAIRGSLPPYAKPLFVRVMDQIPRTATFKLKKRGLMLEGFDMEKIKDPLYYLNKDLVYRLLTRQQYQSLLEGTAGL